jgi:hypothetical protein
MIIVTKQGDRSEIPYLFAFDRGVYIYSFYSEAEYNDPATGESWFWSGIDNSIDEVLGVVENGTPLIQALSLADCTSQNATWYWDDANGYLYVHWTNSIGDWSVNRDTSVFSKIAAGYASGYISAVHNVFDGVYYEQLITKITGLGKDVDPLELGLISFGDSSLSLSNYDGRFDNITEGEAVGLPLWFYRATQETTELTNNDRIFTGYSNGSNNDRDNIAYKIQETRLFENKPICQNEITSIVYPDAGDKVGELMPVAFGTIKRGIMVHINQEATGDPRTITFLVANPLLYSVKEINYVYDQDDKDIAISSVDLNACTVSLSIAAADLDDYDFGEFSWSGKGYDIDGTYNNGLDIIKAGFLKFAGIQYLESTYDRTKWESETLENQEKIGISVQSDKGFIEELIEPITVSLYGVVDVLGDGRISFQSRDITEPIKDIIYAVDQSTEPNIKIDPEKTVSEMVVKYARNFVNDKRSLELLYSDQAEETIGNYGIDRRDPVSPYETVLFLESDARSIAELVMQVISSPDKKIISEAFRFIGLQLFDIIGIDVGRFGNESILYGEILNFQPDYLNDREKVTIRVIDDPNLEDVPEVPDLISAISTGSSIVCIWSNEIARGYKLYYTNTPGNWDQNEIDTVGLLDDDENRYYKVTGLTPGEVYYFSVKAYNSIGDSERSNIRVAREWLASEQNAYNLTVNPATGILINKDNPENGVVPSGFVRYDQTLYDQSLYEYGSFYESGSNYSINGFKRLKLFSNPDGGKTYYQYRLSANNITFGVWTTLTEFIGEITVNINSSLKYMQYRLIYDPIYWFDDQYIRVKEVV